MKQKLLSFFMVLVTILSLSSNVFAAESSEKPKIYGKAAVTMDMDTGEIIYTKDLDKSHMYPASTTKLMTALVFAENKKKTDTITYTESGKTQPEYSLNINMHNMPVGETMTAENAMDALLLYSANDMAFVIGDNVAGSVDKFLDMMNEKAKNIGLKNTHFTTPNGVDNNTTEHYTTPYELAKIGIEAFKNPWVRETMAKKTSRFETYNGIVLDLENRNKLVGEDGCIGGKTGYTDKAGRCLVAFYERNGRKLVGVVMNSIYDSKDLYVFQDMKKIIDWSFDAKKTPIHKNGDIVKDTTASYKSLKFFGSQKNTKIPIIVKEDIKLYNNDVNKQDLKEDFNISSINVWKLNKDTPIGTLTVKSRDYSKEYKLYSSVSSKDIVKNVLPLLIGIAAAAIIVIFAILSLIIKIANMKKRRRRKYY